MEFMTFICLPDHLTSSHSQGRRGTCPAWHHQASDQDRRPGWAPDLQRNRQRRNLVKKTAPIQNVFYCLSYQNTNVDPLKGERLRKVFS